MDAAGEVVLDHNFRTAYNAERGEAMYHKNLRNRGRRPKVEKAEAGAEIA